MSHFLTPEQWITQYIGLKFKNWDLFVKQVSIFYTDILAGGKLNPSEVNYVVPDWLRGFKGDEFQMLLRRRKIFIDELHMRKPNELRLMDQRIKVLYKYLNNKTHDYFWKNDYAKF